MPLTAASFSVSESLGFPSQVTFVDTSSGSDGTLTERRIFVLLSGGTYLVPSGTSTSYISWPIGQPTITVNLLETSTAASITVLWMTGEVATYTASEAVVFNLYDYLFAYNELQSQASTLNPNILQDVNFYESCIKLITNIFNSEISILYASDVTGSQFALDRNQQLMSDQFAF